MSLPVVSARQTPKGTAFTRYIIVKCLNGDLSSAIDQAKQFRDVPQVAATIEAELHCKASVNPGTTSEPAWAAPLAQYGIADEILALLRGASVVTQLEDKFRRVRFNEQIPREVGAGTGGAWIGQNAPTPVVQTAFDTLSQSIYKSGVIVVLSRELLKIGNPAAEATVRTTVIAGVAKFLDEQFLTASVTAVAGLRPAAITNGATQITSTGGTAAQIIADLASLVGAITTPATLLYWVMKPMTANIIAARLAGVGMATGLPTTLLGIPVILSTNSPQQITLIDAGDILFSDDGGFEIDISKQASVEFENAPTSPPSSATVSVSLYQNNLVGIKVMRWIAYQAAHSGSVAWMATSY